MTRDLSRAERVAALLRPRSIAIVGATPDKTSIGGATLANLRRFGFDGALHLVSRRQTELDGLRCTPSIDELPEGEVDVIVLVVPQNVVVESLEAAARRKVKAAVVFASGFAESGEAGRAQQRAITDLGRTTGIVVNGPNCMGLINFVGRTPLTFEQVEPHVVGERAVAVIAQSGAMAINVREAILAKHLPVSYSISTGNEAVLGVEDFLAEAIADESTTAIALFLEQIRQPQRFLELADLARERGKPIVALHTGRTAPARAAAQSHTGALTTDYEVMRVALERRAVVLVDTIDELFDVTDVLARYPSARPGGTAVMTNSGAFRGLALDCAADLGLTFPPLPEACEAKLREILPPFAAFDNPVDLTTVGFSKPEAQGQSAAVLLADDAFESLFVSIMGGPPPQQVTKAIHLLPTLAAAKKPVFLTIMGDDSPLVPELADAIASSGVVAIRSPDRALRALARVNAHARRQKAPRHTRARTAMLPHRGRLAEHEAKALLATHGITTPVGSLVTDLDQAIAAARSIEYPVVLKAQSTSMLHKTDVGGVVLDIRSSIALELAWNNLRAVLAAGGATADSFLLEAMAAPGAELLVGCRRSKSWGHVITIGLGGVWVEALGDVCRVGPGAEREEVLAGLLSLRGAPLLTGGRGGDPLDLGAVYSVVAVLDELFRGTPELVEIEINPLRVHPVGVTALDATILVADADA